MLKIIRHTQPLVVGALLTLGLLKGQPAADTTSVSIDAF